jgi:Response regulator containing CheY-like receiver, AAA-type ATPase, and DNA-binding domains
MTPMKAHRITLVDDDPDSLFLLHRMLLRLYPKSSIATFSNAEDALAHILETGTEFLITSQFMREMTGTQLILELRLNQWTIPIIMISSSPLVKREALEAGATEFLDKHIDPTALEAHIRALFDTPQKKAPESPVRIARNSLKSASPRPTRKLR